MGVFGTDGIRGRANEYPVTADVMLAVGRSAGRVFAQDKRGGRVVIGKDTRLSGYMIENALLAGLTSVGLDVVLTGPIPTPAIGMLTRSLRADLGVMISASHNQYYDNGIKFFGPDGTKITDGQQVAIEAGMDRVGGLVDPERIGRATRIDGAAERYMEFVKLTFPRSLRLDGLKVVVDAANGAAFRVAPELIWELGAEVVEVGCDPDGLNINQDCGSTNPDLCRRTVIETGADLGITLDGDADRVNIIDETGQLIDGDQLLALIARRSKRDGTISGNSVVSTIMSNVGLERALNDEGLDLVRTRVGDRFVSAKMRETGANVGGEKSGHIILSDYSSTGDGLIAALQALAEMAEGDRPASSIMQQFEPMPQVLHNVRIEKGSTPLDTMRVRNAISDAEMELGKAGRLVVRPSGTEPVVRIMAEGDDRSALARITETLGQVIVDASGASEWQAPRFVHGNGHAAPDAHRTVNSLQG